MNKINSRRFDLYKMLMEEVDYRPANFFSNKLSVSTKTIYDDVKWLNVLMDDSVWIEKIPRKGLILNGSSQSKYLFKKSLLEHLSPNYTSFSPEDRQRDIMKRLLLDSEHMTYEQLSIDYVVSVSSLRKDIEAIQTFFQGKDVRLISDHLGTRMSGDEKDIQHVLKQYIFSLLDYKSIGDISKKERVLEEIATLFFSEEIIHHIKTTCDNLLSMTGRPLNDYYKDSLFISLLIFVQRRCNSFRIRKKKQLFMENATYMESYLIAVELSQMLNKELNLKVDENEVEYLSGLLFAHDIKPIKQVAQADAEMIELVTQLIKKMSHMLQVDLQTDEHLLDVLIAHMTTMIYRLKIGVTLTNPLLESVKRQYNVLFNMVWYLLNDVEETYHIQLNDHDISFVTIHFQVAIEKKIPTNRILIVCEKALATSELIYNKIKHALPATTMIETISLADFYENTLDEADMIISSIPLSYDKQKVIYVSPLVTASEMREIKQNYEELSESKSTLMPVSIKSRGKLAKFITPDLVYLKETFLSKDHILDFFSEEACKMGLVTNEFKQSLYEREAMGETSLYTGVAIPHASSHTLKASFLSIITLQDCIQWGTNKVQLIIFIGVAEKDLAEIKHVFAELYQLVETKENVKKMCAVTDKRDLLTFISENTHI
ncbi:transcriptional regulator ManR [Halolactibacillus alkaliphilus]|uniref:Transcriptional regulator ManR n=1 Tax=Halolactibacillus alkaliphilus TaxID=442899 RepID=A0A511WZK2_9BACI|nr:PTS sugar transporter subunit IIA [Halolactibacillus alkaliphilus]GEN56126.1 transcriptional regulator ManR [Halolactibacillus alkaliphilus]GGN67048.1 transcriptional regulator ManR [Halolactibacillus alkaliphilus]SFO71694.1 Transcriptional antiterminator [Halolactibacillus alkaliphilus]